MVRNRMARILVGRDYRHVDDDGGRGKINRHRMDPSLPSMTISTIPEDFVHYGRNRIPTVRELARIQSFPDRFVFTVRGPPAGRIGRVHAASTRMSATPCRR